MAGDNNYLSSAASTRNVGKNVAGVIDHMMTKHNANPSDIHIIGHSLGKKTLMIKHQESDKIFDRCTYCWIFWNVH